MLRTTTIWREPKCWMRTQQVNINLFFIICRHSVKNLIKFLIVFRLMHRHSNNLLTSSTIPVQPTRLSNLSLISKIRFKYYIKTTETLYNTKIMQTFQLYKILRGMHIFNVYIKNEYNSKFHSKLFPL
jgi:hypothetical protein